jgi:HD-GYP domain-containing protein (c-di-GMP phosphodiesterase class II)
MSSPVRPSDYMSLSAQGQDILPPGAASQALKKGMVLRFKKEIPQAIEVLEKAYRLFTQNKQYLGVAFTVIELAWLYGTIHERARSEKLLRETEALIEAQAALPGMNEVRARWLHYKGLLLYQNESYGAALKLFKYALTFCDPQGLEAAKIYDSLGVHYERTGDFHRAVRYLKSSLLIKTHLQEPLHEEAITCQILGRLHLLYEDYELAFQHLQRSLQICSELKDEKRKASLKNELIRLFLRCGKEDEAQELIKETRHECQNRHLKIQYSMTCFYEVYLLYRHGQHEQGRRILEKDVLPVFQKFRYKKGLAMAKRLQAWITFALDPQNTTSPVSLVGEAIELFRWENMIDEVAKSHFELGKLYHEVGNEKLALASFLDALKFSEENGLFYLTPFIEDEIFRTHEAKWEEIVNKRTKHERVFEKPHSLLEALTEIMETHPKTESGDGSGEVLPETASNQGIPFLVSLLKVGQAMAAERDLDKLLQLLKEETERALNADRCTVFLYDSETNELWSCIASGLDQTEEIRFPAHQGLSGYVVKTGEILNVQNAYEDPRFNPDVDRQTGYKTISMLCMPMRNRKGDIIGVFQVLNKKNAIFQRTDEELLMAIASSAGVALENAQLNRELKVTFDSFIKTLSSTIDARDPITAGHSERVMEYALLIGERMHLSDDEMEVLKYAALLHDIGKIGVKEEVLVKEGRLTENEYRHIQEHVYYTYEILQNIHFEKHLACVPEVASSHHEKMDGSGYWRGTKGEHIVLGGRILSVADVFDAITSRRQYRSRMPFDRVMKILREEAGRHFDGDIIDVFLEAPLKDMARILCMDRRLPVPEDEVSRVLEMIPPNITIQEYLDILKKDTPTREESLLHEHFDQLYHFSEISDLD